MTKSNLPLSVRPSGPAAVLGAGALLVVAAMALATMPVTQATKAEAMPAAERAPMARDIVPTAYDLEQAAKVADRCTFCVFSEGQ